MVMVIKLSDCAINLFKRVNFMIGKLYLNIKREGERANKCKRLNNNGTPVSPSALSLDLYTHLPYWYLIGIVFQQSCD